VLITLASMLLAVAFVSLGLLFVGFGNVNARSLVLAGAVVGLGVAAMHYSGMAAVQLNGAIGYDRTRVGLSVLIAIVAATAALWFTLVVRRARWIGVTAAVMALAVCSMHYTGMSAMQVRSGGRADVSSTDALSFLPAILIFVLIVVVALLYAVLADPSAEDREWREHVRRWTDPGPASPVPTPPAGIRLSAGLHQRR